MTTGADAWGRSVSGSGAGWQAGPAWQRLGVAVWAGSSAWGVGPAAVLGRVPRGRAWG